MLLKRPIALIGFTAIIASYANFSMPKSTLKYSLALFAMFIFFHFITNRRYIKQLFLIFITSVISIIYCNIYSENVSSKLKQLPLNQQITAIGVVEDVDSTAGLNKYTVNFSKIDGDEVENLKLYLYYGDNIEVGEKILLDGKISLFTPKHNLNNYYNKNIYGYFNLSSIKYIGYSKNIKTIGYNIKSNLLKNAEKLYPKEYLPIVYSMGYSDKSLLTDDVQQLFVTAGISHSLVVSGLHIGIIYLCLSLVLKYIPIKKKIKNIILCILLWIVMMIIGFTPSIIRACTLVIVMLIAKNFLIQTDSLTVLGCILIVTLINNPYSSTNIGLLLSYSASFGIIVCNSLISNKKVNKIFSSLLITFFAVLFTVPILSLANMQVTILSPLTNLFFGLLITPICILSFFTPIISYLGFVGQIVNFVLIPLNVLLIKIFIGILSIIQSKISFALINVSDELFTVLIFGIILSGCIALIQIKNKNIQKIFIPVLSLVIILCYNLVSLNTITVKAVDSGSQVSFVLTYKNKDHIVLAEVPTCENLNYIIRRNNITNIEKIVLCSKKNDNFETLQNYSDDVYILNNDSVLNEDFYTINSISSKRGQIYYLNINDIIITFSYNKIYMEDTNSDFYFLGSDTPGQINADNVFYFYPLLKKHVDIAEQMQAVGLYNDLHVKINLKDGSYKIIKDVQNFG